VSLADESVTIVGAGPTGALLALLLERRGMRVTIYESRADPRVGAPEAGRSINLALADRGVNALAHAGLLDEIRPLVVPMRGRFVHSIDGSGGLLPYGRLPGEVIYSISRGELNTSLIEAASRRPRIDIRFEHPLTDVDLEAHVARFRDSRRGLDVEIPMRPLIAADGAGSITRRRMAARGYIRADEADLRHGYKELSIPRSPGTLRLQREALHIWPRGGYMLIALPNRDGSFTATLFLPMRGPESFESLDSAHAIDEFLSRSFPDARPLMPDCVAEFQRNPTGFLGTVQADRWQVDGRALLIGDAAHAIVPFHGQGMNCCFEDCVVLDAVLPDTLGPGAHPDARSWDAAFTAFHARRKPDADAIAEISIENYLEMRERVADPKFLLQQSLARELEARYPKRFVPRYSMVMFHHEIPYLVALQRGRIQSELLAELTADAETLAEVDYARAARAVESKLPELASLSSVRKL
jgi:kynurenine 3-monooxygenase